MLWVSILWDIMGVNTIGELEDQDQSGKNFGIWTLIK